MSETKKVALCCPFLDRPTGHLMDALEKAMPLLHEHGWEDVFIQERGCPYISCARAVMLRKALDQGADTIVFLDYDLSFDPKDLLKLVETPDDVVAGTYRFKTDEVKYMATIFTDGQGFPMVRADGCIRADKVPAGFLKITRDGVRRFMRAFPELCYGDPESPSVDLFNHGAYQGLWYGEDYAFSRRWHELGGDIWLIPDINLHHHSATKTYPGNFHQFLMAQPGGSNFNEVA